MLFEKKAHRTVEIEDYNVLIDVQNLSDQPVKSNMRTYDNIWKIAIGQGYDYTTGCSLDYPCFKEHYQMIVIDLVNNICLILTQKQYKKLALQAGYSEQKVKQYLSLLKK